MYDIVIRGGTVIDGSGQPAFTGVPASGRKIEQHALQTAGVQRRADRGGRFGVRKLELDRAEARPRRPLEASQERHLGEQHLQVGGEPGHGSE